MSIADGSLGYQQYIFPEFYGPILSILQTTAGTDIQNKLKNYFKANSPGNSSDANEAFVYFFSTLASVYLTVTLKSKTVLPLTSKTVQKMAQDLNKFRLSVARDAKKEWYDISKSILGTMSSVGFTNISTNGRTWRRKLESSGAGYNSTEQQCNFIIGPSVNKSTKKAKCSFCKMEFTPNAGGCVISCEHLIEVGLLTFLVGLTPNLKKLPDAVQIDAQRRFQELQCYFWACQRCNMVKSNIQQKNYGKKECSIFVKFDPDTGFQPNEKAIEEFCMRILDSSRGGAYILKCKDYTPHIKSIRTSTQAFNLHMNDVVRPLTIKLNDLLNKNYGNNFSHKLSTLLSIGMLRYAKLDALVLSSLDKKGGSKRHKKTQYGGLDSEGEDEDLVEQVDEFDMLNKEIQQIPVSEDPNCPTWIDGAGCSEQIMQHCKLTCANAPKFISKQQLLDFLMNFMIGESMESRCRYLVNNIEDFNFSFNSFLRSKVNNFELLYGLFNNILAFSLDGIDSSKYIAYYNYTGEILIKSLCTLSNFETSINIFGAFMKGTFGGDGVTFKSTYISWLNSLEIDGEGNINNVFTDYTESFKNIVVFPSTLYYHIVGPDGSLQVTTNGVTYAVYKFEDYVYILTLGEILLGRVDEYDDDYDNVIVTYLYPMTNSLGLQPGTQIKLQYMEDQETPNIKDICVSICGSALIIVDPATHQVHGGFKNKKSNKSIKKSKKKKTK